MYRRWDSVTPPVSKSSTLDTNSDTNSDVSSATYVEDAAPAEPTRHQTPAPVFEGQPPSPQVAVDFGSPRVEPGASLENEAFELLEQRRFKEAVVVAGALARIRPDDIIPDAILAVAGSNNRWNRSGSRAAARLQERLQPPNALENSDDETIRRHAIGWGAMSSYFLAFGDHASADHAARQLLEIDPDSSTAWWQLAASYAGLGWFDETEECITAARFKDPLATAPLARWQVGRAVNRWAMTKTPAIYVSAIMWIFVGLLAFAVYLTTPFLARELRVMRLEGVVRELAKEHWDTDARRRVLTALAVLGVVAFWITGLILFTPASG